MPKNAFTFWMVKIRGSREYMVSSIVTCTRLGVISWVTTLRSLGGTRAPLNIIGNIPVTTSGKLKLSVVVVRVLVVRVVTNSPTMGPKHCVHLKNRSNTRCSSFFL